MGGASRVCTEALRRCTADHSGYACGSTSGQLDWLKFVEGLLDVEECLIHPREGRWAPALVMVSSEVGHDTRIQIQDGIVPLMVEGGRRGANEGALTLTRLVPHAANALLC